jgi:chromosomal replication initiator protein
MANDPKLLWDKCLNIIQENVTEQQYTTWFKPITFQSYEKPALMVQVPSPFVYEYLEEHYVNLLRCVLIRVFGAGTQLMYRIEADKTNNITMDLEASKRAVSVSDCASTSKNIAITNPITNVSNRDFCSQLNPNYNFENFIEGNSNKLTCSVGQAVAKQPAHTAFNPFFIFGPSGVGKTHLLNAIGIKIKELHPNLRVLYVSAHLFQVQYTDSVRNNTVNDFINFYQTIDVLLIDDIQEFTALTKDTKYILPHLQPSASKWATTCTYIRPTANCAARHGRTTHHSFQMGIAY